MTYKLSIKLFKCLKDVDFVFKRGLNAICGEHGTGKTTVLQAMQYVLTGKASGSRHKQERGLEDHHLTLENDFFFIEQGKNATEGQFFRGTVDEISLNGERIENREIFLNRFNTDSQKVFDDIISRILFYYHSPNFLMKQPNEMVDLLSKSLGGDLLKISQIFNYAKQKKSELKTRLNMLTESSRLNSGLQSVSNAELQLQIAGLNAKVKDTYSPEQIKFFREELAQLEAAYLFAQKKFEITRQDYSQRLKTLSTLFNAESLPQDFHIQKELEARLKKITNLQIQSTQLRAQIAEPLHCPQCNVTLLYENGLKFANLQVISQARQALASLQIEIQQEEMRRIELEVLIRQSELRQEYKALEMQMQSELKQFEIANQERALNITKIRDKIEKSLPFIPMWEELLNLKEALRAIENQNTMYLRFKQYEQEIITVSEQLSRYSFFVSNYGFPIFRNGEFINQIQRCANLMNAILAPFGIGSVEFQPSYDEEGLINGVKCFFYNLERGAWFDYDSVEASLSTILSLAAFLAQKEINPHGLDRLELFLVDDPAHLTSEKRVQPFLEVLNSLPVVTLLAWSYDITNLIKPTQIITLK